MAQQGQFFSYNRDMWPEQKKVLVALTGDINSIVAAYLLQKQGYQVSGLSVIYQYDFDEESEEKASLERIKALCGQMGMSFYASDASMIYQNDVIDPMVASRLEGVAYPFKVYTVKVLFDVLIEKADYLGIPWVATGHYARIIKDQKTQNYNVYTSDDFQRDQSYFFSMLKQKALSRMLLPLGNIREQEVLKLAESLGDKLSTSCNFIPTFESKNDLTSFISEKIPHSMIKEGTVVDYKHGTILEKHEGIHLFTLGEKNLKISAEPPLSFEVRVCQIDTQSGIVYLLHPNDYQIEYLWVKDVVAQGLFDISKPMDIFLKYQSDGELLPATLYFKNNHQALLKFSNVQKGLIFAGDYCVVYSSNKGKSRVLFGGVVSRAGQVIDGKIETLPERDKEPEEKAQIRKSIFGSGLSF